MARALLQRRVEHNEALSSKRANTSAHGRRKQAGKIYDHLKPGAQKNKSKLKHSPQRNAGLAEALSIKRNTNAHGKRKRTWNFSENLRTQLGDKIKLHQSMANTSILLRRAAKYFENTTLTNWA